jgi:hypothetical protein
MESTSISSERWDGKEKVKQNRTVLREDCADSEDTDLRRSYPGVFVH